jgi:hypothetical protein
MGDETTARYGVEIIWGNGLTEVREMDGEHAAITEAVTHNENAAYGSTAAVVIRTTAGWEPL